MSRYHSVYADDIDERIPSRADLAADAAEDRREARAQQARDNAARAKGLYVATITDRDEAARITAALPDGIEVDQIVNHRVFRTNSDGNPTTVATLDPARYETKVVGGAPATHGAVLYVRLTDTYLDSTDYSGNPPF